MSEESKELCSMSCVPCRGGVPKLEGEELKTMLNRLNSSKRWTVVDGHHLYGEWKFKNFKQALAFTNQIGDVAEAEGHHPDITTSWGKVSVVIYTHKIDGLHEADFVLAAKLDKL